jgi:hypothetical protein
MFTSISSDPEIYDTRIDDLWKTNPEPDQLNYTSRDFAQHNLHLAQMSLY